MIGIWGILIYVGALLILGLLSLVALKQWRRQSGIGSLLLMVLMVSTFLLMAYRGIHKCVYLYRLNHLSSEAVESMEIPTQAPISAQGCASILEALHDAQWLEPSHSGWRRPLPLLIQTKDGRRYHYLVARYKYGAVILADGEGAFSRNLSFALLRNGIVLPDDVR